MDLRDATVLLTGASGGLGEATARVLAERGARLILSGRRVDALEALAGETGGRVLAADLADRAEVDRLVAEAGDVDVLVANAALPADGRVDDYSVEQIDRALDVNLRAPILLARALAPKMVDRGRGSVVLVSSLSGKATTPGSALYSATKFGLRGFGLALRQDLHDTGVGVTVVLPGFISDAGMFAESKVELPTGVGTKTPEDVGRAVARAVERNPAEIVVAPAAVRLGADFAGIAPALGAAISRRMGAHKIQEGLVEAHRPKR
jgi:short-subunit dehydrogenase